MSALLPPTSFDELGLHRGRRALKVVLLLLVGALGDAGWELAHRPSPATPRPVAIDDDDVLLPLPVAHRPAPAPATRRSSAARVAPRAQRTVPAPKADPRPLSAPPLVMSEPVPVQAVEPVRPAEPAAPAAASPDDVVSFNGNGEQLARGIANAKRSAVQKCFESELKRTPDLNGRVDIELDLAPPQQVNGVRVSDDLERPEFTRCVTSAMQRLSFAGLNEEVSIHLPYLLTARGK